MILAGSIAYLVQLPVVAGQNVLVILLLQRSHFNPENAFLFWGQTPLHVFYNTPQQVRFQLGMQLRHLQVAPADL